MTPEEIRADAEKRAEKIKEYLFGHWHRVGPSDIEFVVSEIVDAVNKEVAGLRFEKMADRYVIKIMEETIKARIEALEEAANLIDDCVDKDEANHDKSYCRVCRRVLAIRALKDGAK